VSQGHLHSQDRIPLIIKLTSFPRMVSNPLMTAKSKYSCLLLLKMSSHFATMKQEIASGLKKVQVIKVH